MQDSVSTLRFRFTFFALALMAVFASGCNSCGQSISKGLRPTIQLNPSSLIFDVIPLGDTQDLWVTVGNDGDGELVIGSWRWQGDASDFSVSGLDNLRLQPGEEATLVVTYAPQDQAPDSATIVITSNAANDSRAEINVTSPGQSSRIDANPRFVDVSADRLNEPIEVPVSLFNIGSGPFEITGMRLETGLSHFSLSDLPDSLPESVDADGAVDFTVTYTPATGGVHNDRVIVDCDADNCENGKFFIELTGTALTPYLVLSPSDVGFGAIPIGTPVTAEITATNEGQAVAVLNSISIAPNPLDGDDEIQILSVDGEPWDNSTEFELEPDASTIILVQYTPADNTPDVETLVVRSNDPELPIQSVRLAGQSSAPRLEVFPTLVDFGLVAVGFGPVERAITIRNTGSDDLTLDPLQFLPPRGATPPFAFTLVSPELLPSTLAPAESHTLKVRFDPLTEAEQLDDGFYGAVLVLPTNDPSTAEVTVQMQGFRAEAPVCEIRVIPPTINFGTVPRGSRREGTAIMRNVGSGPCEVRSAQLETSIFDFIFSNYFAFEGAAPAPPQTLAPGDEIEITASYFPRTLTPLSETFGDAGSVVVDVRDPYASTVSCGVLPGGFSGSTRLCGVNLQARSAIAEIAVIPGNVDFGLVTLGCNSQAQAVRTYNTGTADVQITGMRLDGCGSEYTLSRVPALPRTLSRGEFIEVDLTYRPGDVGATRCNLVVEGTTEGGGDIVVPIQGEGVTFSRTVDQFEQVSGREVDVLFVIDNSGSMGEEQSNLSRNFSAFISAARTWDTDFQIGVVTTQVEGNVDDPTGGTRQPGQLLGNPRIITPTTPSYETAFSRNARVGTGDPGTAESGLESARLALVDPQITDLDAPCDADCVEPYMCVSGRCGGYNRTFLRENASLEIIFVSDEEDQSNASEAFFIDFFRSIKGEFNDALFHASAIAGPRGGCSSSDGDAAAGDRYINVAEATNGGVASICDREFATALANIGNRAFGLRRQFALSRVADPASVQVFNLSSCSGGTRTPSSSGWTFDRTSNSIIWAEGSEPGADTCFEVEYEAACF